MARRLRAIAGALRTSGDGRKTAGRVGLAFVATLGFGLLLWHRLEGIEGADIALALARLSWPAWVGALAATAVSFWAVGRYDETAHRHLATAVPAGQARIAGLCAIALSQFLGLGVVTGALVRWRMLPSLTLWQAGRLTLVVSGLFLAGWAVVTAAAVLAFGGPMPWLAAAVLAAAVGAALVPVWVRWARGWPNLYTVARMVALAAVDCGGAALAFWCLWSGAQPAAALVPVFLLALGAGLLSGTPGGIGAFELTLLALLPGQDEPAALAAVLAWRGVYFVIPAVLAGLMVLQGPRAGRREDVVAPVPGRPAFPEAGLMRQGKFQPLVAGDTLFAAARTAHALVALRGPLAGGGGADHLRALMARAGREARAGVVYKAPPRLAAAARRAGLAVLPLAREAWLDPTSFALEDPARAALRRKLRKAALAGVSARCESLDLADLTRINADWIAARGGEQGFSMGRFEAGYLAGQRVYVARIGPRPVAFASFHAGPEAWALDLLRPAADAPDGTAHCLIAAALADAARAGAARLSLAAVPEPAFRAGAGAMGRVARHCPGAMEGARGLWQFKQAFAPRWERLYLLAPSWSSMVLAGWDIRRAIRHPPPLNPVADGKQVTVAPENEIASRAPAWHRKRR